MKNTQASLHRRMPRHCSYGRRCQLIRRVKSNGKVLITYRKWLPIAATVLDDPPLTLRQIDISITFLTTPTGAVSDLSDDNTGPEPLPAAFIDQVNTACEWLRQTLCRQTDQAAASIRLALLSAEQPSPPDDALAIALESVP